MAKIILDGVLVSLSSLSDGSVKVVFTTQELDETKAASLFSLRGKYCKAMYSNSNITPMEERMIDEVTIQDGRKIKSRAQRMRGAIYILWEQTGGEKDWDSFYADVMDEYIADVKSKLVV